MEKFRFARIFGSDMVLQRDREWKIWGYGAKGKVTVCLIQNGVTVSERAVTASGEFSVRFAPVSGGTAAYEIRAVCGEERAELHDVVFGDVWLAAGQSNMEYRLFAVEGREEERDRAKKLSRLRYIELSEIPDADGECRRPYEPQSDLKREFYWKRASETGGWETSAVALSAAVRYTERTGIPVGIINVSVGGLSIDAYLRREILEADEIIMRHLKSSGRYVPKEEFNAVPGRIFTQMSGVYNEKIAPLIGLGFQSMLWYQGESSCYDFDFAVAYRKMFSVLIDNYRRNFGEFYVVAVQIAPQYYHYGDKCGYLYINEALEDVCRAKPRCEIVPIYDLEPRWLMEDGELFYHPIHPVNKIPIGERIAEVLYRCINHNEEEIFPYIKAVDYEGKIARLHLSRELGKWKSRGFSIAGKNGKYYPASAECETASILRLFSEDVEEAASVCFAFCQYQDNFVLQDTEGKPFLPFRTKREPMHAGYYTHPSFADCDAAETYESCYGYQSGMTQKVPTWLPGKIYRSKHVDISFEKKEENGIENCLFVTAVPKNEEYYFFGASPAVCLSGQRNHLADYGYLKVKLSCAEGDVEFRGLVVRLASGEIFRFPPANGRPEDEYAVLMSPASVFVLELQTALAEDSSKIEFSQQQRREICEAELLFRSRKYCRIKVEGLVFTDHA